MVKIFKIFTRQLRYNQSVESAGVAFVKRANERNKFFEKNKQTVIYDEQAGRTRLRTNNLRDELIWGRIPSVDKGWCIIPPIQRYSSYRYFQ